jgi:hypothetical protein
MRSNQSEKETIIQWAVGGILLVGCLLAGYKITSIGFVGLQAPGSSSGTPTSSNVADGFVGLQAPGSSSGTPTSSNVAEKSWCLGVKEQWEFNMKHFNEDRESIKAMFNEGNCSNWGITIP